MYYSMNYFLRNFSCRFLSGAALNAGLAMMTALCLMFTQTIFSAKAKTLDYGMPDFYSFVVEPEVEHLMQDIVDYAMENIQDNTHNIEIYVYNPVDSGIQSGTIMMTQHGKIYFDIMFIRTAPNLDAIAGVVLHEIAHAVTEDMLLTRHIINSGNVELRSMANALLHLLSIALHRSDKSAAAVSLAAGGLLGVGLPEHDYFAHSRREEKNADIFALQQLARLGYDFSGAADAMVSFNTHWGAQYDPKSHWYYTHPAMAERVGYLKKSLYNPGAVIDEEKQKRVESQRKIFELVKKKFSIMGQTLQESIVDMAKLEDECVSAYALGYAYLLHEKVDDGIEKMLFVENECQDHNILNKYAFTSYHLARAYLSSKNIEKATHYSKLASDRLPKNEYLKTFAVYVLLQDPSISLQKLENIVYKLPANSVYSALAWRLLSVAYNKNGMLDLYYLSNAEFGLGMANFYMYKIYTKSLHELFGYMRQGYQNACFASRHSNVDTIRSRASDIMERIAQDMTSRLTDDIIGYIMTNADPNKCKLELAIADWHE